MGNDSMLDIVRDVMDNEMTCMSDSFDIKDLFDVEKLLSDYEFRDFVCGDPDHDDDEDEDGFEMISRFIIIILLIVILVVLLIVLYVQFRIIRQVNKNTHSAPRINLNSNLVDNYHGPSDDKGSVDNIEKKLAVPSAGQAARPSSGNNAHPQTRFLKQPQNLPAPPVFHNITNDVNKPDSVKKQRPGISGVTQLTLGSIRVLYLEDQ